MELFKLNAKIDVVHVAYKGAAPAISDAIGGQVNAAVANLPALLAPEMRERMTELVIDAAPTSPEEFAAFITSETARWARVVKDAAIPQQ